MISNRDGNYPTNRFIRDDFGQPDMWAKKSPKEVGRIYWPQPAPAALARSYTVLSILESFGSGEDRRPKMINSLNARFGDYSIWSSIKRVLCVCVVAAVCLTLLDWVINGRRPERVN